MFLSFSLDGWSDRAERWVKARFWRWLTASGRSDQSHRLAPVSITPYTCHHNQREGREGKGKTTHSRQGALTTDRPLLVNACLIGETCAKHIADICYTASGLRAEWVPRMRYTYFPKQELKFSHPENMFLSFSLDGWSDRAERWVKARFWRWLTASGRSDQSHRLAPMV